ncbi:MAG: hypothetical protein Q8M40_10855 [Legionella sp.]|nr:hypothetical protein [Legionella sp.]
MDSNIKSMLSSLYEELNFSQSEQVLMDYSNTPNTSVINHTQVLSNLILAKQIKKSTDAVIDSNKELALSENNNSIVMQRLTWALVFVGFFQVIEVAIQIYINYQVH